MLAVQSQRMSQNAECQRLDLVRSFTLGSRENAIPFGEKKGKNVCLNPCTINTLVSNV